LSSGEVSSHVMGGGRHHSPHAQKIYIKKCKRLAEPVISNQVQQPEIVEAPANPIQIEGLVPNIVPPSSSSSDDDVD